MKAEFLQNFKVGDAPLPKEVVDAILAENARDVEAAKKPFADYDAIKEQLNTAREGLKAFEGVDVKDLQGQVAKLTKDLSDKEAEHQAKLAELEFDGALKDAYFSKPTFEKELTPQIRAEGHIIYRLLKKLLEFYFI